MPPRITYNTTGLTAGTEIVFTKPVESETRSLGSQANRNVSDNGSWETVHRFTEREFEIKFNYVPLSERNSYETFFTTWACQGKSFLYWPTTANESTYYTVKLKDSDWKPVTFAKTVIDHFDWTHTFRMTV